MERWGRDPHHAGKAHQARCGQSEQQQQPPGRQRAAASETPRGSGPGARRQAWARHEAAVGLHRQPCPGDEEQHAVDAEVMPQHRAPLAEAHPGERRIVVLVERQEEKIERRPERGAPEQRGAQRRRADGATPRREYGDADGGEAEEGVGGDVPCVDGGERAHDESHGADGWPAPQHPQRLLCAEREIDREPDRSDLERQRYQVCVQVGEQERPERELGDADLPRHQAARTPEVEVSERLAAERPRRALEQLRCAVEVAHNRHHEGGHGACGERRRHRRVELHASPEALGEVIADAEGGGQCECEEGRHGEVVGNGGHYAGRSDQHADDDEPEVVVVDQPLLRTTGRRVGTSWT